MSRLGRGALAAAVIAAAVVASTAGCIPPRPSSSPPPPSVMEPSASAGDTPDASTAVSTSASPSIPGGVVVDPVLLEHLPPDIAGVPRTADAETADEIARQPLLETFVSAIAMAIYPSTPDYAVATVARLRPGVYDEDWFRDWRDTFDEGVCAQAGGVDTGRSEIELGGRPVHRSACRGGVVIYHAWLPESGTVVSIQGAGPLDMGRSVVSGLTE